MSNYKTWYDELQRQGIPLTQEQRSRLENKINEVLTYEPKIGVFGKTGVGKSSLCNALFGQDVCPISDVQACTRNPQEVILNMGSKGLKLLDVPGVGESQERDEEYAKLYAELLPKLDLVLWVVKADDRAMAADEKFYQNVIKPHVDQGKPFLMVVNQVDKVEPMRQWNDERNEPGPDQLVNICKKASIMSEQFRLPSSVVITVSANEKYNLTRLVDEIVYALPRDKNITLFKAVNDEFRSPEATKHVESGFLDMIVEAVKFVTGNWDDLKEGAVGLFNVIKDGAKVLFHTFFH